ncbi:MAG: hypothetical protein GY782_10685 [Gammaproteobacteria bacterium]|nr:hypothetical protein [Gammaproteobacteria bacterium]
MDRQGMLCYNRLRKKIAYMVTIMFDFGIESINLQLSILKGLQKMCESPDKLYEAIDEVEIFKKSDKSISTHEIMQKGFNTDFHRPFNRNNLA